MPFPFLELERSRRRDEHHQFAIASVPKEMSELKKDWKRMTS